MKREIIWKKRVNMQTIYTNMEEVTDFNASNHTRKTSNSRTPFYIGKSDCKNIHLFKYLNDICTSGIRASLMHMLPVRYHMQHSFGLANPFHD